MLSHGKLSLALTGNSYLITCNKFQSLYNINPQKILMLLKRGVRDWGGLSRGGGLLPFVYKSITKIDTTSGKYLFILLTYQLHYLL